MIAAVSFVVSAVSLMLLRTPVPEPVVAERTRGTARRIRDGATVVLDDRLFRAPAGSPAIYTLFLQWIITLTAQAGRRTGLAARTGGDDVNDMTAERSESRRPQPSEVSSYPHRGGTQ